MSDICAPRESKEKTRGAVNQHVGDLSSYLPCLVCRPGSFCTHTYKSTELLLEVLNELGEWDSLVLVSNLLHRTPEAGK